MMKNSPIQETLDSVSSLSRCNFSSSSSSSSSSSHLGLSPASSIHNGLTSCSSQSLLVEEEEIRSVVDTASSSPSLRKEKEWEEEKTIGTGVGADSTSSSVCSVVDDEKREKCRLYFQCAVRMFGTTHTGMLLKEGTSEGEKMAEEDAAELYQWLKESLHPYTPFDSVMEIGAGVGRLTPVMQHLGKKVIAIDFQEEYIRKNERMHRKLKRPDDEFVYGDATILNYPPSSVDFVLWNWLLMYLSHQESLSFVTRAFTWVKKGGFVFCRESCGEPSNKKTERSWAEGGNPTEYRHLSFYTWLFEEYLKDRGFEVEFIFAARPVNAYIRRASTDGQRCWLMRKIN